MRTLLFQRNFALLWFAGLISIAGDKMLFVALPLHVYLQTGSTFATSLIGIVTYLPSLVLGPIAGIFVDRGNRQRIMVGANLIRAAILLLLLLIDVNAHLWVIYLLAALESSISTFFGPAENALLPNLVGEEHLVTANALNSLNNNLALLIGPALGGLVFTVAGLAGVALVDVVTYLIGAMLIANMRDVPHRPTKSHQRNPIPSQWLQGIWRDLRLGFEYIRTNHVLIILCMMSALASLGEGLLVPLWVPFLQDVLSGSESYIGFFFSVQAIGGLLGGILFSRFGERWAPAYVLGLGAMTQGLIDLIHFNAIVFLPAASVRDLAVGLVILFGIPSVSYFASFSTLLQKQTEDSYRGRVFSATGAIQAATYLTGLGLSGFLSKLFGIVPVMNIEGVLLTLVGFIALRFLLKTAREETE